MRHLVPALALAALAGCYGSFGAQGGASEGGVRQVGDTTLVEDAEGATLVIDENGCQSVVPRGSRVAEPVTDADGAPVCVGAPG